MTPGPVMLITKACDLSGPAKPKDGNPLIPWQLRLNRARTPLGTPQSERSGKTSLLEFRSTFARALLHTTRLDSDKFVTEDCS